MAAIEVIGDSARGDEYRVARLTVDGDRVVEADTPGLSRPLAGLTLLEAAAVPGEMLAADAAANALAQVMHAEPDPRRIAVAMSGGVDSAVALHRAGPHSVGVTLRLWADPAGPGTERVCCSPAAVVAARSACHARGLPHVTLDLREVFRDTIVAPFVDDYRSGLTPNPCMRCNGSFRFDALLALADRVGAATLWTGHYARLVDRDGTRLVARAADPDKDQSYMLATVAPELLARIAFPLGDQTKAETRAEAAAVGLDAATRPESQDACFLAGGDYRGFLRREGVRDEPGPIVTEDGVVVGTHDGVWSFTRGQRRGIAARAPAGTSAGEPLYVIRTDASVRTVVVGPRASLGCTRVTVRGRLYAPTRRAFVKVRYRGDPAAAAVEPLPDGFDLVFDQPVSSIAPGQTAVLYVDGAVVGAGSITATTRGEVEHHEPVASRA